MKRIRLSIFLSIFACNMMIAQQLSWKEQSLEQFKKENYSLAISLMEKALKDSPEDAEVYYYLGVFTHYNAYDSRPLQGYDPVYSQKVLNYLDKALELNPEFGDARYFCFTEFGAAAFKEYQKNNLSKVMDNYEKAYQKGVIPEWAVELGRNMLASCDSNAILFTHGDFAFNICLFVQLHYNFRKDISVVPLTQLELPSFTLALNDNGDSGILRGIKTGSTKEQILEIHPYKWDTLTIKLPVPPVLSKQYSLPDDYSMNWKIEPDLSSDRIVAKVEGETPHPRTYLSPARAVLLSIIETNHWERPVFFTNTFETYFLARLDHYLQNCGLVSKLVPLKTENTQWSLNVPVLEKLVLHTKLEKLKTVIVNDQPRASGIVSLYRNSYYWLAGYYHSVGRQNEIAKIIDCYKQNIMIGFKPGPEKKYLEEIEKLQE
jgi:tetratricopeptide (TPR) repeat protein